MGSTFANSLESTCPIRDPEYFGHTDLNFYPSAGIFFGGCGYKREL